MQQLKLMQNELKTVKKELMQVSRTEKLLIKEIEKNEAELKKLRAHESTHQ